MSKKLFLPVILLLVIGVACGTSEQQLSTGSQGTGQTVNDNSAPAVDSQLSEEYVDTLLEQSEMKSEATVGEGTVTFDIELMNSGSETVELGMSGGQQYEIVVADIDGYEVYRFSEGKAFIESFVYEEIASNDALKWTEVWDYEEEEVAAGEYEAMITLLPSQINQQNIESNPFLQTKQFTIPDTGDEASLPKADSESTDSMFQNMNVEGTNGQYVITGEISPSIGEAYYSVEDGHYVLVEETEIVANEDGWSSFEIKVKIETENLPSNGTLMLILYNKNPEDGQILTSEPVTLEQF